MSCGDLQISGLKDGQAALDRQALYRAGRRLQTATRGPVGLSKDQRYVVPGVQQTRQRALSEGRGAGEDEAQESARRSCAAAWRASRGCAAA